LIAPNFPKLGDLRGIRARVQRAVDARSAEVFCSLLAGGAGSFSVCSAIVAGLDLASWRNFINWPHLQQWQGIAIDTSVKVWQSIVPGAAIGRA